MGWNEQAVLSDMQPLFAIKDFNATLTAEHRNDVLSDMHWKSLYLFEYESMSGNQTFLNAIQNYKELSGMKANLYKCFLPQAWTYTQ